MDPNLLIPQNINVANLSNIDGKNKGSFLSQNTFISTIRSNSNSSKATFSNTRCSSHSSSWNMLVRDSKTKHQNLRNPWKMANIELIEQAFTDKASSNISTSLCLIIRLQNSDIEQLYDKIDSNPINLAKKKKNKSVHEIKLFGNYYFNKPKAKIIENRGYYSVVKLFEIIFHQMPKNSEKLSKITHYFGTKKRNNFEIFPGIIKNEFEPSMLIRKSIYEFSSKDIQQLNSFIENVDMAIRQFDFIQSIRIPFCNLDYINYTYHIILRAIYKSIHKPVNENDSTHLSPYFKSSSLSEYRDEAVIETNAIYDIRLEVLAVPNHKKRNCGSEPINIILSNIPTILKDASFKNTLVNHPNSKNDQTVFNDCIGEDCLTESSNNMLPFTIMPHSRSILVRSLGSLKKKVPYIINASIEITSNRSLKIEIDLTKSTSSSSSSSSYSSSIFVRIPMPDGWRHLFSMKKQKKESNKYFSQNTDEFRTTSQVNDKSNPLGYHIIDDTQIGYINLNHLDAHNFNVKRNLIDSLTHNMFKKSSKFIVARKHNPGISSTRGCYLLINNGICFYDPHTSSIVWEIYPYKVQKNIMGSKGLSNSCNHIFEKNTYDTNGSFLNNNNVADYKNYDSINSFYNKVCLNDTRNSKYQNKQILNKNSSKSYQTQHQKNINQLHNTDLSCNNDTMVNHLVCYLNLPFDAEPPDDFSPYILVNYSIDSVYNYESSYENIQIWSKNNHQLKTTFSSRTDFYHRIHMKIKSAKNEIINNWSKA